MQRTTILTAILMMSGLALLASGAAMAQVYEWKDANGVTQFTETPPASGKYIEHSVRDSDSGTQSDPATPSATPVQTSTTADASTASNSTQGESSQCVTARKNVELLQGEAAVQRDTDGDGEPDKILDDTERANQLELARATITANCSA